MNKFLLIVIILMTGCERPTETGLADDGIPPSVPANLSIYYASDGEIIIEWKRNNEPDLKGFNIYRKIDSGNYNFIIFTTDDYYIDDSLDYTINYSYKISAIDISGRESDKSPEVTAMPVNKNSPGRPNYLSINGRNWLGQISFFISWYPNDETDLAGYNIYKGNSSSFESDSNSFLAFSPDPFYNDSTGLSFYRDYYYKIRAVDKGGLLSPESETIADKILEVPEMLYPPDNYQSVFFNNFKIKALEIPAVYRIIVQENQFFGEAWSGEFSSNIIDDTISIAFNNTDISYNRKYYWRVITYSNSPEPNSVSEFKSFIITQ